jgi:RHS repeat-associated protein
VTHTYYDTTVFAGKNTVQQNLRKRVSSVRYEDVFDGNDQTYQAGTHYDYDIHGNVRTLVQENTNPLIPSGQNLKRIDYDYDLISGKVNDVHYQNKQADAFHHHYEYDADNRITQVFTSKYPNAVWTGEQNHPFWDNDASYFYYAHGPLARKEIGDTSGDCYDFGARMYNPRLGRWMSCDPYSKKYPHASPFAFSLNTPIGAKDPDGKVVIFINGMHNGDGGQSSYWGGYDKKAMDAIGDHSARYVDGALGGG